MIGFDFMNCWINLIYFIEQDEDCHCCSDHRCRFLRCLVFPQIKINSISRWWKSTFDMFIWRNYFCETFKNKECISRLRHFTTCILEKEIIRSFRHSKSFVVWKWKWSLFYVLCGNETFQNVKNNIHISHVRIIFGGWAMMRRVDNC